MHLDKWSNFAICLIFSVNICNHILKSLGPIDRKFHGHGENDEFVLYEHIIKQFSGFCKHTNISDLQKKLSNKITCKQ